jgi:flagellar secretion chaperone FliS
VSTYSRNSRLAAYQTVAVHGGVANADPHALVLMLMDAAAERLAIARGCAERRELKRQAALLHSCVQIITELRASLNLAQGGPLAQNLSDLYEYMTRQLVLGNARSDAACIGEVASLLEQIRSAWAAIGPEVRKTAQPPAPPAVHASPPVTSPLAGARYG